MGHKPTIQGHRGARGSYPENTLSGFIEAIKLGVSALEMDVVISKDLKIVVSHEPWMNDIFCTKPDGSEIEKNSREKYNLYKMSYAEIAAYDCGKRGHPEFPSQKKIAEHKPLLSEVISAAETYCIESDLPKPIYNIEIKSELEGDDLFHPPPHKFAQLVYNEINRLNIDTNVMIQSFDVRVLQEMRKLDKTVHIGLLIENRNDLKKNLQHLGFLPDWYNPHFPLITTELIKELHDLNIKIAAWTVNEIQDMKRLINMGIDSIITDHPERAIGLIK